MTGRSEEDAARDEAEAAQPEGADRDPACRILERLEVEAPEILQSLREEQRRKLLHIVTGHVVMKHHHGPLPSPDDIAAYNRHITNGADRIMEMAEKQSEHRRSLEKRIVESHIRQSGRGQIFGLAIGVVGILAGLTAALTGHDVVGGGIAGATVISLVYAFVTGQRPPSDPEQRVD